MMSNLPSDWNFYYFTCCDCGSKYHAAFGKDCACVKIETFAKEKYLNYKIINEDEFFAEDGEFLYRHCWEEIIEKINIENLTAEEVKKLMERE